VKRLNLFTKKSDVMKKGFIFSLLLLTMGAFLQSVPNWANPEVFAINKEATRATSIPYPSAGLALAR
jgi:beta-galactosidase